MRCALAAVLIALLPACATVEPARPDAVIPEQPEPPGPALVATSGPHTLRFVERQKFELRPSGFEPIRSWWLHFGYESTDPDCLVTDKSAFECRAERGGKMHAESGVADFSGPLGWTLDMPYESVPGTARDLEVDLSIFRVHQWKTYAREGLMDASLDEIEMPPFLLRFAGEGESCWLAVSMAEPGETPPGGADPSTVVSFWWATRAATVVDAKGRVLVPHSGVFGMESAQYAYSTHKPGTPPPEKDPTIVYPVTVRLSVPSRWDTEVRTFRFRGLPEPPPESPED